MSDYSEPTSKVDRQETQMDEENWREMITDEQYQYMQENDILADCTFVVGPEDGETREFKAHRVHIARVSPVFEAMLLRVEMMEAKTGHVRVTDLSPNTFHLLLSFIYGKEPETTSFEEASDLALAADKYQMKSLFEKSLSSVCKHVTPENVWTALKFVRQLLPRELLKAACIKVMQENTVECIGAEEFSEVDEEDVALLLEQDVLNVENELVLVEAVVTWARSKAQTRGLPATDDGVRAVLEPRLLSLLRLLTVPPVEFAQTFARSNLLTTEEKWALNVCLHTRESNELPKYLSASLVPRKRSTSVFYCNRSMQYEYSSYPANGFLAKLIFRVKSDVDLKLLGFEVQSQTLNDATKLGSPEHSYEESLKIEVRNCGRSLLANLAKVEKLSKFDFTEHVVYNSKISILLPEPILLNSENWFRISVSCNKNGEYRSYGCLQSKVVCQNVPIRVEFEFYTSDSSGYLCSKYDGLFRSLIFSL